MKTFAQLMMEESTKKLTENQAMAYSTTDSALLDLFGTIGALRDRSEEDIIDKFRLAFLEDEYLAVKMLFYAGNIRGGLGERRTFKVILNWLGKNFPEWVEANLFNIAHYNRWDSIFALIGTAVEESVWEIISIQLISDLDSAALGNSISLLAKWLPSPKTASKKTMALARLVRHKLGLSEKKYRQMLSSLRKCLDVVEVKMSARKWEDIDFSTVPSYAMKNYGRAFARNCPEGFEKYLDRVINGKEKITAGTLYPYDLVGQIRRGQGNPVVIEEQWKALPNYLEGINAEANILVMADVSGSMEWANNGRPMNTSIGLAIYFAQRNKGLFNGVYMTFTDSPRFMKINKRASLEQLVDDVERKGVGYNTNLEKAFKNLLHLATMNHVPQSEMPKALVIISDMEIDNYISHFGLDFVETMKLKFKEEGYTMPQLVCWNVEARNDTFLTKGEDTLVVSGQSASVFKNIVNGIGKTAYQLMIDTLNGEEYDDVREVIRN